MYKDVDHIYFTMANAPKTMNQGAKLQRPNAPDHKQTMEHSRDSSLGIKALKLCLHCLPQTAN